MATDTIVTDGTITHVAGTNLSLADTLLISVPTDIQSVTAVSITANQTNVQHQNDGSNDDTYGMRIKIEKSDGTVLAAGDINGLYVQFVPEIAHPNAATWTTLNSNAINFAYVNTSATQADWNAARLYTQQRYDQNMGGDDGQLRILNGFTINITYDPTVATLSSPTTTNIGINTATVGCTSNRDSGTLYYYVSTSATPPSATDLKNGTGAVDSGSTSSVNIGANTFGATGLTPLTNYYTHFIQNNGADSNILTSSQWTTADPNRTVACSTEQLRSNTNDATITKDVIIRADFTGAQSGDILIAAVMSDTTGTLTAPDGTWTLGVGYNETRDFPTLRTEMWYKTSDGTEGLEEWTGVNNTGAGYGWVLRGHNLTNVQFVVKAPVSAIYAFGDIEITPQTGNDTVLATMATAQINDINSIDLADTDLWVEKYKREQMDGVGGGGGYTTFVATELTTVAYGVSAWCAEPLRPEYQRFFDVFGPEDDLQSVGGNGPTGTTEEQGQRNLGFNGTAWSTDTAANIGLAYHSAAGASSTAGVVFAGNDYTNTLTFSGATQSWNGTAWTTENSANVITRNSVGFGTDTAAIKACGQKGFSGSDNVDDTEEFNGTSWTNYGDVGVFTSGFRNAAGSGTAAAGTMSGGYSMATSQRVNYHHHWNGTTWAYETDLLIARYEHAQGGARDSETIMGGIASDYLGTYSGQTVHNYSGTAWSVDSTRLPYLLSYNKHGGDNNSALYTIMGTTNADFDFFVTKRTKNVGDLLVSPMFQKSTSGEYSPVILATITKIPGEIYATTEELAVSTTTASVVYVPHTFIEVPSAQNMLLRVERPKVRGKRVKKHIRPVIPKWTRAYMETFPPIFDNTQLANDRPVTTITAPLVSDTNTATITKTLTVDGVTETLALDNNGATVQKIVSRTVNCSTEALALDNNGATVTTERVVTGVTEALLLNNNGASVQKDNSTDATTEQLALDNNGATVGRGLTVTCTTEALVVADNDATIQKDRSVQSTTEQLVVDSNTATIRTDRVVTATTEQLVVANNGATVDAGRNVGGGTEALLLAAQQALIQTDREVSSVTEELALGAQQGLVSRGRDVLDGTEALVLTAADATVSLSAGLEVVTQTETLILTPNAGTADLGRDAIGSTQALALAAATATITKTNLTTGVTEELVLDATATVSTDRDVGGVTETLVVDATGAVTTDREVGSTTEQLVLTANTASIITDRLVTCTTEQLVSDANTATVTKDNTTTGVTEALVMAAAGAQIFRGFDRDVNSSTEALVSDTNAATVQRDRLATGVTEALVLTANQANTATGRPVDAVTEALVLDANTASVTTGRTATGITEQLELGANTATIFRGFDLDVIGATEQLLLTGVPASVSLDRLAAGVTQALVLQALTGNITTGRDVRSTTEQLLLTEIPATIGRGRSVQGIVEELILTANLASVERVGAGLNELETIELVLTASRAYVEKMTITNPLPDYRNIDVEVIIPSVGMIVISEDDQ